MVMFKSGLSVKTYVEQLKSEIDIATPFLDDTYIRIINEVLQLLYSEIIKEESCSEISNNSETGTMPSPIELSDIKFENITKVYADDILLSKSTISNVGIFPNIFYREIGNSLGFSCENKNIEKIRVFYNIVPALLEGEEEEDIPIPYEWLPLISAKVRGEIYKLVNEDAISAKWLNDYNNLLEDFKVWCSNHYSSYLGW